MAEECPHGGMPEICPPCQDADRPSWAVSAPVVTEAKYASRCPGCDEEIDSGDRIARVDGNWVCWWCA